MAKEAARLRNRFITMKKKRRRHISWAIKLLVIERQHYRATGIIATSQPGETAQTFVRRLIRELFGDKVVHLQHRPALINRPLDRHGETIPAHDDPGTIDYPHLIYMTKQDHNIETYVSGIGAQRSDFAQRRYLKRVRKNRDKSKRPKAAWPKRKLQSRNDFKTGKRTWSTKR